MTLLPSLFQSRSSMPAPTNRNLLSELQNWMNDSALEYGLMSNGNSFPMDVEEENDKYTITAELPGVEKKDVDITLQDRLLTIQVKQEGEKEEKKKNYICKERWLGSTSRSIMLPHAAGEKDVDATLKEGVLSLTVKKHAGENVKKIAVQ